MSRNILQKKLWKIEKSGKLERDLFFISSLTIVLYFRAHTLDGPTVDKPEKKHRTREYIVEADLDKCWKMIDFFSRKIGVHTAESPLKYLMVAFPSGSCSTVI